MGFGMRKRFGQNFLVNGKVRERIMGLAEIKPGKRIWEIGPGLGAMTALALDAGAALTAFEIDSGFIEMLRRIYGAVPGFRVVAGDFVRTWQAERAENGAPDVMFGNLPYNAAAAMLASLVENGVGTPRFVITVQKEAAQRMIAKPCTKDYSAFTVLCRSAYSCRVAFDIGRSSFWPQPHVESSVVVFDAVPAPLTGPSLDRKAFSLFTRASFATRRKTIRNNLKAAGWEDSAIVEALRTCAFREDVRAEALDPAELAAMCRTLGPKNRGAGLSGE